MGGEGRLAAYLELYRSGKLRGRIEAAKSLLRSCHVCPRHCGPCYKAHDIPSLARPISAAEFQEAVDIAHQEGLYRLDKARPLVMRF
ncbi:MAG TPA: hypothetical protein VMY79_02475 [Dehalococcoidia bacterium]|nr:hypothetical protein [Dehalococcoidia bacterium]